MVNFFFTVQVEEIFNLNDTKTFVRAITITLIAHKSNEGQQCSQNYNLSSKFEDHKFLLNGPLELQLIE